MLCTHLGWFKESRDNFSCFIWKNLKVAFKNTIFWYWIWALIHANQFYNLELIEFEAYIAPTCISIALSIWDVFLKKINNLQSWTNLLRENRKSIFPWKSFSYPKSILLVKFEAFGNKNWPELTLISGGKG